MAEENFDVDPIPYDADKPGLEDVDNEMEDVDDEKYESHFNPKQAGLFRI